ncbi:MAG: protein jag [Chloroflexi bacterium]|nr:protein jag [Chloroflexota bacterium]MCH8869019.1 protein jag [Chloroflexota bacterium]MCI0770595.1 protein jag [Chloroflexota bacterium]MCI0821939.1 protein jag [Chloroflexota bacterium]MCI0840388.1 protein jag [Chloroflexota bacterium]
MKTIETTAKNPEEAIEIALKELDAERGEVEIDVISRGKAGILGIGSELAKVRVTLIDQPADIVKVTSEILDKLIAGMGVDVVVNLQQAHNEDLDGPVFEIEGDDSGLLIGRRGETLRALQFLVKFIASRKLESRANILVDVEGYQARRYDSLANLAHRVAQRVASSGRSITLEPMPPNERRAVHIALADHPGVTTESTGMGDGRQVIVQPK